MDLYRIIGELVEERNRIVRIIASLEEMAQDGSKSTRPPGVRRRGRKSMDGSARQEVSERMKRYWAERREREKAERSGTPRGV
jgi:hypothetical protein